MALPTITPDDFKGWVKITANHFKEVDLEEYIDTFREQYLRHIVGDGAFQDITNQTRQKWDDLINGVEYVDADNKRRIHNGLVKPLIYFIYFEFVRDYFEPTQPGNVKAQAENSERNTGAEVATVARSRYNAGVRLVDPSTACFLEANKEIEQGVTASVDNADNTYTLSIPSTKYLEAGDVVSIEGVDYTAQSVTIDDNIVIDAGQTGLDFLDDAVIWEPYEAVEYCPVETAGL